MLVKGGFDFSVGEGIHFSMRRAFHLFDVGMRNVLKVVVA